MLLCQFQFGQVERADDRPGRSGIRPVGAGENRGAAPVGVGAGGGVHPEELEAAKRSLIATYCSILDVPSQLEDFQFGQNLAGLTFGPDELAEIIRVIDAQQVVEAAQRIQLDTSYFLMGPEGGEEDAQ